MSSQSNQEFKDISFNLTIRDRINFPFLLAEQISTFQKAILNTDYSRREIEESIQGLAGMIPSRWEDEQYQKDRDASTEEYEVDNRPTFAGVPSSNQFCEDRGIPLTRTETRKNYFKLLHAVIDLLERRGMLSRRQFTEQPTGMPEGEEALPEGMNLQEYIASLEVEEEEEDETLEEDEQEEETIPTIPESTPSDDTCETCHYPTFDINMNLHCPQKESWVPLGYWCFDFKPRIETE